MKERLKEIQEALLTGVSYMLPFVISGGLLVAIGFLLGGYNIPNDVAMGGNFASTVFWLGKAAFGLMVPILGAYTAYSIADKPGIAPGMIAGWMATDPWGLNQASGFLGGLIGGIIAGYLVVLLKKIPMPAALRSLLPTLIIPLLGVAAMGLIMVYVIGGPIAAVTNALTDMLNSFWVPEIWYCWASFRDACLPLIWAVHAIKWHMHSLWRQWIPETIWSWVLTSLVPSRLHWESLWQFCLKRVVLQRQNAVHWQVCLPVQLA